MSRLMKAFAAGLRKSVPSGTVPVRSNGLWGFAREPYAGAWQQGMTVDPIGAITSFGAVFSCITRIANDIAKMEMKARVKADGIDVDAAPTSPFWRVLRKPNTYQNRIQFIAYWIICKLLHGNAYALKLRDNRGMVFALYPLDPRRVTPMVTPGGDVYYSLGGDDLSRIPTGLVVPAREIIHDRGATIWHPLIGISPIVACAVSATQGNRIQSNSAKFFENMSRPSGMLTAPATIDDVTASRLKREFEANFGGGNIGRLAVLGDGLTYEQMTIPAEQAQLIDQLKWTVEDVARCFQVPLYKINAGPIPTAGNVETLHIQYLDAALHPYIESFEQCMTEGLEMDSVNMWMELDLDGLLRMDSLSRVEMLTKASGGAFMKPNEARQKWNLPPVKGGDALYKQQQDYSLEALAKRDSMNDPFGSKAVPAVSSALPPDFDLDSLQGRDGLDGEPGRDAVHVEVLDGIDASKKYQRGTFATYRGGLVRSFRATDPLPEDGELEKHGWHVVVRGITTTKLELSDDMRTVTLRQEFTDGEQVEDSLKIPAMIYRGVWRPDVVYVKGDATTYDGCTWLLSVDEAVASPGTDGSGWDLAVRRGRDGRDGTRGEKGDRGAEGRPGKDLTQMSFDGKKY